ncbi:MAG TPA: hypothetical protein VFY84_19350 [Jiangellales bacterium]|nr:hypothetical protein [Jiangellales bacterium]
MQYRPSGRRLRVVRHDEPGPAEGAEARDQPDGLRASAAPAEETLPAPANRPTRALCAAVHVDEKLRAHVREMFFGEPYRAWAPCYSVNLVALLRHTAQAHRLALWRDALLAMLVVAMVGVAGTTLGRAYGPVVLVAFVLALLALVVLRTVLVGKKVTVRSLRWALWDGLRHRPKQTLIRVTLVLAGVVLLVAVVLTTPAGRLSAAALAVGLAGAWLLAVGCTAFEFVRASRLVSTDQDAPANIEAAAPLRPAVEQRARSASEANALVYARDRTEALGPFLGAGHRVIYWQTPPVNIRLGQLRPDGKRGKPKQVDVVELHDRLAAMAESLGLPKLVCGHRLYADGRSLRKTATLLPEGSPGPPQSVVPEEVVLARLRDPQPMQRSYLCLQVTDWSGDIVVTMFVRAVIDAELLQLELSLHALPVVELSRTGGAVAIPRTRGDALTTGLRRGSAHCVPLLLGSPGRCAAALLAPVGRLAAGRRHRRRLHRGRPFDFGAAESLREHLAMGQSLHYNALVDQMGHADRLQHRLIVAVAEYLDECGIDSRDFTGQSQTIIYQNQQNVFKEFKASAVTFGTSSAATVTGPPAAPPPPQAPASPPAQNA